MVNKMETIYVPVIKTAVSNNYYGSEMQFKFSF